MDHLLQVQEGTRLELMVFFQALHIVPHRSAHLDNLSIGQYVQEVCGHAGFLDPEQESPFTRRKLQKRYPMRLLVIGEARTRFRIESQHFLGRKIGYRLVKRLSQFIQHHDFTGKGGFRERIQLLGRNTTAVHNPNSNVGCGAGPDGLPAGRQQAGFRRTPQADRRYRG